MKSIRIIIPALITGFFVVLSQGYASAQDKERQNQQQQQNQQEQLNQQQQDIPEGDDRTIAIDGLPQSLRDTLKSEYGDWIPVEVSLEPETGEGTVYRIKMHDADGAEAKIIKMTRLGEIIDEQEAGIDQDERNDRLQRGRQDQEGSIGQDQEQHMDHGDHRREDMGRENDLRQEQRMDHHDDHHTGARDQERALDPDNLPAAVKEKIREDYKDWRPTEAFLATDPGEGMVYRVKLENDEEDEYKSIKITHDGEVLDQEDVGKHEEEDRNHDRRY
jgi:hypothetical protein